MVCAVVMYLNFLVLSIFMGLHILTVAFVCVLGTHEYVYITVYIKFAKMRERTGVVILVNIECAANKND